MYLPDIHAAPLQPTGPADPSQPGQAITHTWPLMDDGEVSIGVWTCGPGSYRRPAVDYDEMMFMAGGRATVGYEGGEYDLVPGATWVKSREWPCTWTVHQTIRKMYVIDSRSNGTAPPAFEGNAYTWPVGDKQPHPQPLAGHPRQVLRELWVHNGLEVGVWESDPGSFAIRRDGFDEAMIILSGRATMHSDNGQKFALQPGAMLHTPNGFSGYWTIDEPIRKVYVKVMR